MSYVARFVAALCAAILLLPAMAEAQGYPNRPIRLIVTFPPGGSTDLLARAMQPHLEKTLGQPIVIDNRPGAGGDIGVDAVAKAAPDGHTIGIGAAGALAVNVSLKDKMPYNVQKDLTPITLLTAIPFVLVAGPGFEGKSGMEFPRQTGSTARRVVERWLNASPKMAFHKDLVMFDGV